MNRELLSKAVGEIDEAFVAEAYRPVPEAASGSSERIVSMKKKRIFTLALAAALVLALGAAAYAAGLFGLRAMQITEGSLAERAEPGDGYFSMTQPQDVPEEMGSAVREKIDNSAAAWAEWRAWCAENAPREPESCKAPEGSNGSMVEENEDGTVTMIFLRGEEEIERRVVSGEDYAQFEAYWEMRAKGFSGYDFNYHVYTQEMADKLEEIAVKHGLKLRHEMSLMWQNIGEVDNGYEREEITAAVDQICAGGKSFFRTEPTGYDKFYFYDEGTFAVSFFTTDELSNLGTSCYLYNSPYGTLSSGTEIFDGVKDIASFSERTHTTPDGTVLTVLENGTDMFAYVYLDNSFVTLHIVQPKGLSEAEVDAILDMVDFSTIS